MLDTITKRRIDTARDILVGKLPDPKSQVEQITIALIYKFMDDMDKQAEELGGKASFFIGEYEKYSWSKIFDSRVSGYERINLYGEAIQKMNQNPHIPQLFRNIFKNAYLPYRDPETLKMFLKVIGDFEYDHSEKLGDAFEYLLSIMGSQGDAGQFRTPRHIIDFMVKVVDPCKNETVLDPACGTAGFLISSYNHILNKNKKDNRSTLTSDEKTRLISNFSGYDISPDMVRLSLVNMYLHKFSAPKIYEYDTLSSEERWNEVSDVILANPPFMSPKGGIKPHKRFSIQANRSEVLFVDYIAEHLNPNGRGGVIVPEGIIFQSGIAYKKLRKMLIENALYAVVSLPSGVFNPYSGVKTSILFLNKNFAKKIDKILFVKVNNDGFGLGAQRREVKENDLPLALEIINKYKQSVIENKEIEFNLNEAKLANVVKKEKIAESGEYNLSGDRYKEAIVYNGKWDFVELGEFCDIYNGSTPSKSNNEYWDNGTIPWFTIEDIRKQGHIIYKTEKKITKKALYETSIKLLQKDAVLLCCTASIGEYAISKIQLTTNQQFNGLVIKNEYQKKILPDYIFWLASTFKPELERLGGKTSFKFVSIKNVQKIKIPFPPLEIQEQIVAELDNYQKIIDGAKQVVENYKPTFKIDSEWEMIGIGDVCEFNPKKSEVRNLADDLEVSFVPMADLNEYTMLFSTKQTKSKAEVYQGYTYFRENDVLLARVTPCFENGKSGIARNLKNGIGFGSSEYFVYRPKKIILPEWIYYFISSLNFIESGKNHMTGTGGLQRLTKDYATRYKIPFPPLKVQQQIVTRIENEQKTIDSNKELITIFENKIKDKIAEVWGG
ncbi:N-6 DNA methylase [bacterium]|nr:N-6 DNA methylase [bacterium]